MSLLKIPPFLFIEHLKELETIAGTTNGSPQAALKFYKAGARNELFKLESLARIYRGTISKHKFEQLYQRLKAVEDELGKYDYNEELYIDISAKKGTSAVIIKHFQLTLELNRKELHEFLVSEGWLPSTGSQYITIKKEILEFSFPSAEELRVPIANFIITQIEEIIKKYDDGTFDLNDIEGGLHELRRRLRWISLYAQVTSGLIQLKPTKNITEEIAHLIPDSVKNSPFNKLPSKMKGVDPLYIEDTNFYLLSKIIAELGVLKDRALKAEALISAAQMSGMKDHDQTEQILEHFGMAENEVELAADKAREIADVFFHSQKIPHKIIQDLKKCI